jgi:hypothetical protein
MLFSLVLVFFTLNLKEEYKFQEPSLKTKIFDVMEKNPIKEIEFRDVFEGIKAIEIEGILNNECILVAFPACNK